MLGFCKILTLVCGAVVKVVRHLPDTFALDPFGGGPIANVPATMCIEYPYISNSSAISCGRDYFNGTYFNGTTVDVSPPLSRTLRSSTAIMVGNNTTANIYHDCRNDLFACAPQWPTCHISDKPLSWIQRWFSVGVLQAFWGLLCGYATWVSIHLHALSTKGAQTVGNCASWVISIGEYIINGYTKPCFWYLLNVVNTAITLCMNIPNAIEQWNDRFGSRLFALEHTDRPEFYDLEEYATKRMIWNMVKELFGCDYWLEIVPKLPGVALLFAMSLFLAVIWVSRKVVKCLRDLAADITSSLTPDWFKAFIKDAKHDICLQLTWSNCKLAATWRYNIAAAIPGVCLMIINSICVLVGNWHGDKRTFNLDDNGDVIWYPTPEPATMPPGSQNVPEPVFNQSTGSTNATAGTTESDPVTVSDSQGATKAESNDLPDANTPAASSGKQQSSTWTPKHYPLDNHPRSIFAPQNRKRPTRKTRPDGDSPKPRESPKPTRLGARLVAEVSRKSKGAGSRQHAGTQTKSSTGHSIITASPAITTTDTSIPASVDSQSEALPPLIESSASGSVGTNIARSTHATESQSASSLSVDTPTGSGVNAAASASIIGSLDSQIATSPLLADTTVSAPIEPQAPTSNEIEAVGRRLSASLSISDDSEDGSDASASSNVDFRGALSIGVFSNAPSLAYYMPAVVPSPTIAPIIADSGAFSSTDNVPGSAVVATPGPELDGELPVEGGAEEQDEEGAPGLTAPAPEQFNPPFEPQDVTAEQVGEGVPAITAPTPEESDPSAEPEVAAAVVEPTAVALPTADTASDVPVPDIQIAADIPLPAEAPAPEVTADSPAIDVSDVVSTGPTVVADPPAIAQPTADVASDTPAAIVQSTVNVSLESGVSIPEVSLTEPSAIELGDSSAVDSSKEIPTGPTYQQPSFTPPTTQGFNFGGSTAPIFNFGGSNPFAPESLPSALPGPWMPSDAGFGNVDTFIAPSAQSTYAPPQLQGSFDQTSMNNGFVDQSGVFDFGGADAQSLYAPPLDGAFAGPYFDLDAGITAPGIYDPNANFNSGFGSADAFGNGFGGNDFSVAGPAFDFNAGSNFDYGFGNTDNFGNGYDAVGIYNYDPNSNNTDPFGYGQHDHAGDQLSQLLGGLDSGSSFQALQNPAFSGNNQFANSNDFVSGFAGDSSLGPQSNFDTSAIDPSLLGLGTTAGMSSQPIGFDPTFGMNDTFAGFHRSTMYGMTDNTGNETSSAQPTAESDLHAILSALKAYNDGNPDAARTSTVSAPSTEFAPPAGTGSIPPVLESPQSPPESRSQTPEIYDSLGRLKGSAGASDGDAGTKIADEYENHRVIKRCRGRRRGAGNDEKSSSAPVGGFFDGDDSPLWATTLDGGPDPFSFDTPFAAPTAQLPQPTHPAPPPQPPTSQAQESSSADSYSKYPNYKNFWEDLLPMGHPWYSDWRFTISDPNGQIGNPWDFVQAAQIYTVGRLVSGGVPPAPIVRRPRNTSRDPNPTPAPLPDHMRHHLEKQTKEFKMILERRKDVQDQRAAERQKKLQEEEEYQGGNSENGQGEWGSEGEDQRGGLEDGLTEEEQADADREWRQYCQENGLDPNYDL